MVFKESKYWLDHTPKESPYRPAKQAAPSSCNQFDKYCTDVWRTTMIQWFYEVADCFDFDRGVVCYALSYLDRVIEDNLRTKRFTTKKELQLTAVTTLYIAMKLHGEIDQPYGTETKPHERKKLTIQAFVVLSKHQFDAASIEAMELVLLTILDWQLNPPDARATVACMLELMPEQATYLKEWRCIFDIARYIAELSLGEIDLVFEVKPSVIALSSILCAIHGVENANRDIPADRVLQRMSGRINNAASIGFGQDLITQTAIRLNHLCPYIIVKEKKDKKQRKRKSSATTSPKEDQVSVDETMDKEEEPPRKTSPVCVVESCQENPLLVKAGCHGKR